MTAKLASLKSCRHKHAGWKEMQKLELYIVCVFHIMHACIHIIFNHKNVYFLPTLQPNVFHFIFEHFHFQCEQKKKTNMNSKNKSNCCLNDLFGLSANLDMVTKKGTPMTNQNSGSKEKSYPQNSQKKIIYSTVQSNVRLFRLCTWSNMRKYAYNEYLKKKQPFNRYTPAKPNKRLEE